MDVQSLSLDVHLQVDIKAPIDRAFEGLIHRLTAGSVRPDGVAMPFKLEQWPGGRWYRDLGNDDGHLWAFVQSIKKPTLLEFVGPLFMSYPVSNHVIARLSETNGTTRIDFRHRAFGFVEEAHRAGVGTGWKNYLDLVKNDFEKA